MARRGDTTHIRSVRRAGGDGRSGPLVSPAGLAVAEPRRASRATPAPSSRISLPSPLSPPSFQSSELRSPRSSPAMATAHLRPALAVSSTRRLTCKLSQPRVSAQPGRRAVLRSCSLPLLLGLAAAGRGGWRAAAAVESRTVQQGEDGAEGAAQASSKLVLVVGGTGGVGTRSVPLLSIA
jgi:hypothetical protein